MTERKWTPGPWVVVADETAAQVTGFPCVYANGYTVVGTEGMYGDIDTDFANAHLISAAPDLYEALDQLIAISEVDCPSLEDLEGAKEALAKARGEA